MSNRDDDLLQDFYHIVCYYHSNNRKVTAVNLWANGMSIFKRATIIEKFDLYKKISVDPLKIPSIDEITPFVFDSIMDKTRIITCFENFMKGSLIINDVVVHEINAKVNATLKYRQKHAPVKSSELFSPPSFKNLPRDKRLLETLPKTLNFTTLLRDEYQDIVRMPTAILDHLKLLNEERNKLHFMKNIEFEHSQYHVDMYTELNDFVDNIIRPTFDHVNKNLEEIKSKLPQGK